MPQNSTKLNALYPRRFTTKEGEQVHWMKVGVAWLHEGKVDIKLWLTPPSNADGEVRILLREATLEDEAHQQQRRPAQPPARPPYGQREPASEPEDEDQIPF